MRFIIAYPSVKKLCADSFTKTRRLILLLAPRSVEFSMFWNLHIIRPTMYLLISSLLECVISASSAVIDSEPALLASNPSEWVNVPGPGANPASSLQVACNSRYGAQMEPRSCFNALDFAPLGDQQETWLPWPAGPVAPPRRPGVVQLLSCFLAVCRWSFLVPFVSLDRIRMDHCRSES